MAATLKRLYHGQPSTAGSTAYTCPGGKTAVVLSRVITNPSPVDITVRLGLIPSGGTSDGTHYLLGDLTIPARSAFESSEKIVMAAGDVLEAQSGPLPAPVGLAAAGSSSGGTLAAATYYYKITGTNGNGETLASSEVNVVTTGTTSSVALTWSRLLGATGYKIYRSTATGAEALLATISGGATVTATDTGSSTSGTTPPATATASGCIFTISGAEL